MTTTTPTHHDDPQWEQLRRETITMVVRSYEMTERMARLRDECLLFAANELSISPHSLAEELNAEIWMVRQMINRDERLAEKNNGKTKS